MMKSSVRNGLLIAVARVTETHSQEHLNEEPDELLAELHATGDALLALSEVIDADPAGIVPAITEALESVARAIRERQD